MNSARDAYRRFVQDGMGNKPWEMLNGPDILGDDNFRSLLQSQNRGYDVDIPKRKQLLRHLPLAEIEGKGRKRGDWMREAYSEHGYTMQAIADYAGLHHSTVSLSIKEFDNNPPFKG